MSTPAANTKTSRRQQFVQTYRMTKKSDPRIGLILALTFVVFAAVGFGITWLLPGGGIIGTALAVVTALLLGLLAMLIIFGRRAQKAAYRQMEGQLGAASSALQMLRKGWKTYPAVAFNKQQDLVHRVVGPPGIVLVGEGNANRLRNLMGSERRKHERVTMEVPIHEVVCGDGEGEVPLTKLVRHLTKKKRQLKPAEMTDVINRLKALDAQRSNIPMPKGPVPQNMKGLRGQMRGR